MGFSSSKTKVETLVFDKTLVFNFERKELKLRVKVPLKEKLKKNLIFGLDARLPIAIILGFFGWR